jgi:hypothetical protein
MNSCYLCLPGEFGHGLTNQLYTLINGIIIAQAERRLFLLVGSFNPDYERGGHRRVSDLIDLPHLNTLVSDLTILDQALAQLTIERIEYGSYFRLVDLTQPLMTTYYQDRVLSLPPTLKFNDVKGDPHPNVPKKLMIHFQIDSIRTHLIYEEERSGWIKLGLSEIPVLPKMNLINRFNKVLFDRLVSQIRFTSYFSDLVDTFFEMIDGTRINVIHTRLEVDALNFWGPINHLSPDQFDDRLSHIYIKLIDRHFDPTIPVLVLTGTISNSVIDYLHSHKYKVHIGPKNLVEGRELNAILDLLAGERCTDVFIGNVNPHTFTGSTFSYVLWQRMSPTVTKVLLDLDHIDLPPFELV